MATMARALLYLRVTSLVGRVTSRLKRLRQPKYLIGAVVGAAWIWFAFLRRVNGPSSGRPGAGAGRGPPEIPAEVFPLFLELGAIALILVLLVNWTIPRRATLSFSEAEIAFLFPAPVNRRMLIHYRLLGAQLGIVFTSLVLTVLFRRGQGLGGNLWFHAVGWWIVLATLNLHITGTSFVYSKLLNRSLTTPWRKIAAVVFVYAVALVLFLWTWLAIQAPQPSDLANAKSIVSYVATQTQAGPLPWLLAIPKALIAPYFARSVGEFLLALGPAFVVLIAHYFWVVRTEVAFEEASLARAEKRAATVRAAQRGDWRGQTGARKPQRAPFNLRSTGPPEIAFLWKNLLSTSAIFRPKVAIFVAAIIVLGSEWVVRAGMERLRVVALVCFTFLLGATLLFGPLLARQDLRSDLSNSDILKTYPLLGWQILLGELLAPLAILTAIVWTGLLGFFLLLPDERMVWLTPAIRGEVALALAVLTPPFVTIQLLVPNAASVVFPAWAHSAGNPAERGIEVMGQRIIYMTAQLLVTVLAVIPAAIAASIAFFIAQWIGGMVLGIAVATAVMFIALSLEAWAGVRWLGGRFEHFDLSAELRP
jgi:ABC-2 type transport system permease protein